MLQQELEGTRTENRRRNAPGARLRTVCPSTRGCTCARCAQSTAPVPVCARGPAQAPLRSAGQAVLTAPGAGGRAHPCGCEVPPCRLRRTAPQTRTKVTEVTGHPDALVNVPVPTERAAAPPQRLSHRQPRFLVLPTRPIAERRSETRSHAAPTPEHRGPAVARVLRFGLCVLTCHTSLPALENKDPTWERPPEGMSSAVGYDGPISRISSSNVSCDRCVLCGILRGWRTLQHTEGTTETTQTCGRVRRPPPHSAHSSRRRPHSRGHAACDACDARRPSPRAGPLPDYKGAPAR